MSSESFYGGRMGASFIIVKQFDGIDIPRGTQYKKKVCAIYNYNGEDLYYYPWIEKNKDNYSLYSWKILSLDGSTVDVWDSASSVVSQQVTDIAYAEGMRQCFEQGGDTTDIVNYGEYVIIDTIVGLGEFSNPDNGKVYRRGMNFDYNATTNPLAGAEYIGQIVGPQGQTPEMDITHYEDIIEEYGTSAHARIYNVDPDQDIVPGSWEESGARHFKDDIDYVFATMKDPFGNIIGCQLGFKITTLVQDFEARSMSPYEQRAVDPNTGKYYNYDLVYEDPDQYINGKWIHPFYQKWQVKVPHGYHGIDSTNLELVHTKTMPNGYKDGYVGAFVWTDINCTIPYEVGGTQVVLSNSVNVLREAENTVYLSTDTPIYNADESVIGCKINYNGQELFVKKEDCYMDILRYRETNYDNLENGEIRYYDIGDYNTIQRVTLADDGTLTVFYSAKSAPVPLEQVLRWIDNKNANGITIDPDGTVTVYYNTIDPITGEHEKEVFSKALDWITSVTLTQQGAFTVLFNNDTIQGGRYDTTLEWVDYVTLAGDGTLDFYFNDDHTNPAYHFPNVIKYLSDVQIETVASGSTEEGTGDQKVHLTFNDGTTSVIGNPLNYIIETVISKPSITYPNAPYSHLLVYYADPALRQTLVSKWVTYPSEKYPGQVWTEWVDLGDVKGVPGGIHVLEDVTSLTDLQDSSGNWIPPERLTDSTGTYINPDGAGWAVTYTYVPAGSTDSVVEFYCYDYDDEIWYPIGQIDPSSVDPRYLLVKSAPQPGTQDPAPADVALLKERGFWLAQETAYYAV